MFNSMQVIFFPLSLELGCYWVIKKISCDMGELSVIETGIIAGGTVNGQAVILSSKNNTFYWFNC